MTVLLVYDFGGSDSIFVSYPNKACRKVVSSKPAGIRAGVKGWFKARETRSLSVQTKRSIKTFSSKWPDSIRPTWAIFRKSSFLNNSYSSILVHFS